ncbi:MAG: DUF1697 domain-containing protein, partial [Salinibacterium sp.]|nr:DUF1697 domain-containing protein [Salinibacterium sp.]
MARQVALLRGINVGRAKRIAMADLRARLAGLGFEDVRTLLNSGNVVYSAKGSATTAREALIESTIEASFGVTSRVFVLSAAALRTIADEFPWSEEDRDPSRTL